MRNRLLRWGIGEDRVRVIRHFVASGGTGGHRNIGSYGAFVGRLSPEKGLDTLLTALARAGDPRFLIVGDGPQRSALEALAAKLGLAETRFLGWRSSEHVGDLLAAARYVAVPSVWEETASLVALEALSAARPLLVSDRGALPELVASGAGLVCRPGDEIDLAQKISRLMEDDALCDRASKEASAFARRWLNPAQHLASLESVYGEISMNEVV